MITERQKDLFVARYGDTLSDSEEDEPFMLKRRPPPPLQPIAPHAHQGPGRRPRRTGTDDRLFQQQVQQQIAMQMQLQAQAQGNAGNGMRNGKPARTFFPG